MRVTARTRVFAILGDPVSHSLSPRMHNAAFAALGLDAVYIALREQAASVASLMRALAVNGGGGNVTIPHKSVAAKAVDTMRGPTPEACNTFWGEEGRLIGDNTDVVGVRDTLVALGAGSATPARWLVIGTGGSAQAVAQAAADLGAALAVQSRSTERGGAFLEAAHGLGVAPADPKACQVVINCTPAGLAAGDPLPISPAEVPAAKWALDLVYRPGETAWVKAMRAAGCAATDGREMLLRQGAAALERWFAGQRAPVEVMRAAVRDALV
jgi:shikimate dehydrogenase